MEKISAEKQMTASVSNIGRRVFLAGLALTATVGCKNFVERAQSPDNQFLQRQDSEEETSSYIGNHCSVRGLHFGKLEGIGLAVGLKGTGSDPRPSQQREYLIRELDTKVDSDEIEDLLANSNTELVWLKAHLMPGIRKGDHFDVEVQVLDNSDASSIELGRLAQTAMRPMEKMGRGVMKGHVRAGVKGDILVDALFETRQDEGNYLRGIIPGGGVVMEDRLLSLALRDETHEAKATMLIAHAINERFTTTRGGARRGVAEAKTDRVVELTVPKEYQHNIGRFVQVVINLAFGETDNEKLARLETLQTEITDPNLANKSALRLEGMGKNGVAALKQALRNDDLEVKFHAAHALAYMGHADGVELLRTVAETEPAFRWHALTALASTKDVEAATALAELLHVSSAETRYGAFRAMRARSENDPLVVGKRVGNFFLHRIASKSDSMLHFSRSKRPEIVVFGDQQTVSDQFIYVESGTTVRATGNDEVSITRYRTGEKEERVVCSNRIADIIEVLGDSGMGYGQLIKLFREANESKTLNTRMVVNAVPRLGRTYVPGQADNGLPPEQSERFVTEDVPDLFRDGQDESTFTSMKSDPATNDSQNSAHEKTNWSKMKDWFQR